MFTEILEEKLQDPSKLPSLLFYGAEYLKYLPNQHQNKQIQGCIRIMLAAKEELERCASSTEQSQE